MEQLIEQVQALRTQLNMEPLKNPKKLGKAKLEAFLTEHQPKAKVKEDKKPKGKTIKQISCELLCEVVGKTEEGRTLGRPYAEILDIILRDNPEVKTSLNCLRWYAGKIRVAADGYQMYALPQVRLRPTKVEEQTEEAAA